jgi:type II pantothenate kinase
MIIGIDIGSTTTKIVGLEDGEQFAMLTVKAFDPVTSAAGALGKFLIENKVPISRVESIALTGAGATKIEDNIFDIRTEKVPEVQAIGFGGTYLSKRCNGLIANIGTGTAMVDVRESGVVHVGGTGVGGGTIIGLAKKIINVSDYDRINELARHGKLGEVDLLINDISETDIGFITKDMTASNFAKMSETAKDEDYALGILNMVFQVIGMVTVFAARSLGYDSVVITGNVGRNDVAYNVLSEISDMYHVDYLFPDNAQYATALGAALSIKNRAVC